MRLCLSSCLSSAFLARVLSLEDGVQLLKRPSLCFNEEEVDEHQLKQIPEHEEDVAESRLVLRSSEANMAETHNQYLMFSIAMGAAKVLMKLAQPAVIWKSIMPLALMSSYKS